MNITVLAYTRFWLVSIKTTFQDGFGRYQFFFPVWFGLYPFFSSCWIKLYQFILTGWVWSVPALIIGGFWLVPVSLLSLVCCIPVSLKKGLVTDSFSCLEGFAVSSHIGFSLFWTWILRMIVILSGWTWVGFSLYYCTRGFAVGLAELVLPMRMGLVWVWSGIIFLLRLCWVWDFWVCAWSDLVSVIRVSLVWAWSELVG
jgi:hypothetical protein